VASQIALRKKRGVGNEKIPIPPMAFDGFSNVVRYLFKSIEIL